MLAMRFKRLIHPAISFRALIAIAIVLVFSQTAVLAQESDPAGTPENKPPVFNCGDGELRVGDLKSMDALWAEQKPKLDAIARAWEDDAVLTGLRVSCGILESGFRWQGIYYSPTAQASYQTDTGETIGAEFDPSQAAKLPESISFGSVWRTLAKAGYDDSTTLEPAIGVSIQVNSEATPLGPDTVPVGALICHVALRYLGEVRDLFVSVPDGTIYRHAFP
jgi:hypothetical protein